ncbi:ML domain-containing protein [Streptomyces sp. NPDC016459]|uniref:ML domain-containing protein n=1 Tax=Streptomyces sp. NPDC016459 TaxID=3157190 RepID=UPI0033C4AEEB
MTRWEYTDRNDPSDPLQIQSITVTPDPPEAGKTLTAVIKTTLTDVIKEGACADVTVKIGAVKLVSTQYDLFSKLKGDTSDGWSLSATRGTAGEPIEEGTVEFTFTKDLSKNTPPGKYTVGVQAYGADEAPLGGFDFTVDFSR